MRPTTTDDWIALTEAPLPLDAALAWVVRPDCGAQVLFVGTVRDHAEGREGVTHLEYEAYAEQVEPRLAAVAREARARWPVLGRIALLHRVGRLEVAESSVVVAVSAPHRAEAFEAARFCIDTLKTTVPIWKRESWAGGEAWATCSHEVEWLDGADGAPSLARRPGSGPRPGEEHDGAAGVGAPSLARRPGSGPRPGEEQ